MNEFPLLLPPEVLPYTKHPLLCTGLRVSARPQFAPPVHCVPRAHRPAFARLVAPCASLAEREQSVFIKGEHARHERFWPTLRVADHTIVRRQVRWAEAHVCPSLPRELLVDALLESRTTNRRPPGKTRREQSLRTQEVLLDEYRAQVAAAEEDGNAVVREERLLAEKQPDIPRPKPGFTEEALNHHLRLVHEHQKMLGGTQPSTESPGVYQPRFAVFAVAGCTYAVALVGPLLAGIYLYRSNSSSSRDDECGAMKLVATVDLDKPLSAVYTSTGHASVWNSKSEDDDEDEDGEAGEEDVHSAFVMFVSGGQCLMLHCHKKDATSVLDIAVVGTLEVECGVRDAVVWNLDEGEDKDEDATDDSHIPKVRCHAVLLTRDNTLMLWEPHENRSQNITLPASTAPTTNIVLTGEWLRIQPGPQPYSVVLASAQCVSHVSLLSLAHAETIGPDLVLPDDLVCSVARHPRHPFLLLVCTMETLHLCDLRALGRPLASVIHASSGFSTAHWLTTTRLPEDDAPALWSSSFVVYTARESLSVHLGAVHCDRVSLVSLPDGDDDDRDSTPLTTPVYSFSYVRLVDDIFRDPEFRLQKRFEFPNEITGVAAVPRRVAEDNDGVRDTFVLLLAYSDGSVYAQMWDTISRDEAQHRREHSAPPPTAVADAMPWSSSSSTAPLQFFRTSVDDGRNIRRYSAATVLNRIAAGAPASAATARHKVTQGELAALAPAIRERLAVPTTLADLARFVAVRLGRAAVDPLQLRDAIAQCHELDWMHSFVVNDMSHACTDLTQCTCGAHNETSRDAPYRLLLYAHAAPSEGMPLAQKMLPHYRRAQEEADKYAQRYPDKYVDPEEEHAPNETDEEAAVRVAEQKAATMSEEELFEHLTQALSQSQEQHTRPSAPAPSADSRPESDTSSPSSSPSSEDDLLDSQPLPKKQRAESAGEKEKDTKDAQQATAPSRFGAMSSSSSSSENGSSESDEAPSSFFTQESFFGF